MPTSEANCKKGHIWKLNNCVYGLSDALLKWYSRVQSFVKSVGGVTSKVDPSLLLWHDKNNILIGYILVRVDYFLFAGPLHFHKTVISKFRETKVGKEVKLDFKYIGLNVVTTKSHISVDQHHYIDNLRKIYIASVQKSNNISPFLTSSEKDQLRAKIGQVLWIRNQFRPENSSDVSNLASKLGNATIADTKYCNKLILKVTSNSYELKY